MLFNDLISAGSIVASSRSTSKGGVLQELSERAGAVSSLAPRDVLEAVLQREALGSTGVGNGVAIPHGKLPGCDSILGLFARLEKPVDFDAVDGAPVDLVFMLIAPEAAGADHLKALARVARLLRDPQIGTRLRSTRDPVALFAVLAQLNPASNAA